MIGGAKTERLGVALDWLQRAWRNSPAIPWDVRASFLRIGFEAILKKSGAWEQANALRRAFEDIEQAFPGWTISEFAWTPTEEEQMMVKVKGREHRCTPLQHWYVCFCRYRNSVEHPDALPIGPMYEEGTAYDGPLFQTGERVLRDLIRVQVSLVTARPLFASATHRAIVAALSSDEDKTDS